MDIQTAKQALDAVIRKSRVHFYKPFQLAEVLYHNRVAPEKYPLEQLQTYRTISKHWRDNISRQLVGRVSTSSSRYQDNVFEDNAVPPPLLSILGAYNREKNGFVEAYIYQSFANRLDDVRIAYHYLESATPISFSLATFLDFFEQKSGLKRSIDKVFEMIVYALFTVLTVKLDVNMRLAFNKPDPQILTDFEDFTRIFLGIGFQEPELTSNAYLYRAGVANAADTGIDIWTNFGTVVQVKHIHLNVQDTQSITDIIPHVPLVIVCKTAEVALIAGVAQQFGVSLRGIITQDHLIHWYHLCQSKTHITSVMPQVLGTLKQEFVLEFPMLDTLDLFMSERHYIRPDFNEW